MKPAVTYFRVSTDRQGRSGLGLEAQRAAVADFCRAGDWELLAEFEDIESGKRTDNRPQLAKALALCKKQKATLIVAKLDRLSRDLPFLATLIQSMEKGKFQFRVANLPEANETTLELFAFMAQVERRMISTRTKEALQALKRRGVVLGEQGRLNAKRFHSEAYERAQVLRPVIEGLRAEGITSPRKIAAVLNERGILTPSTPQAPEGARWHNQSVHRLLMRLRILERRVET